MLSYQWECSILRKIQNQIQLKTQLESMPKSATQRLLTTQKKARKCSKHTQICPELSKMARYGDRGPGVQGEFFFRVLFFVRKLFLSFF